MTTINPNDNSQFLSALTLLGNNTGAAALGINLTVAQVIAMLRYTLSLGGTNADLSGAANGGILYSTASAAAVLSVGSTGQILVSGATAPPTWSIPTYPATGGTASTVLISDGTNIINTTATYPSTVTANALLTAQNPNVGTSAVASRSLVTTDGSGTLVNVALSAGGTPIGSSSTLGSSITTSATGGLVVTTGTNTLALSVGTTIIGQTIVSSSQAIAVNHVYGSNSVPQITYTLPVSMAAGGTFGIYGILSGGWKIAQNASQFIHVGSAVTTTGTGGSITSTHQYDSVMVRCIVADTEFTVTGMTTTGFTIV